MPGDQVSRSDLIRRWSGPAALVAGLVILQAAVLNRAEEKISEDRAARIDVLPPGDMLATYVSSLFLGSFRAILVDMVWIELRRAEEQKRIYRQKELLEWLAVLQPRNDEVRQLLSWDIGFNIAETVNPKDRWDWERIGLRTALKGVSDLPNSVYLKWELAQTHLYKQSIPEDGEFDRRFIDLVMGDRELQDLLQDRPGLPPVSPFELALLWMTKAKDQLNQQFGGYYRTQVGRSLNPYWADGFIRDFAYLEGMLRRDRGDFDAARDWIARAEDLTLEMIREHFPEAITLKTAERLALRMRVAAPFLPQPWSGPIFEQTLRALPWEQLKPVVLYLHNRGELEGKWRVGAPILPLHLAFYRKLKHRLRLELGDPLICLQAYEELLHSHGNLDLRFVYNKASEIKRALSGDALEFNDRDIDVSYPELDPAVPTRANIFPAGDRDLYAIHFVRDGPAFVPKVLTGTFAQADPSIKFRMKLIMKTDQGERLVYEGKATPVFECRAGSPQALFLTVWIEDAPPKSPESSTYELRFRVQPLGR